MKHVPNHVSLGLRSSNPFSWEENSCKRAWHWWGVEINFITKFLPENDKKMKAHLYSQSFTIGFTKWGKLIVGDWQKLGSCQQTVQALLAKLPKDQAQPHFHQHLPSFFLLPLLHPVQHHTSIHVFAYHHHNVCNAQSACLHNTKLYRQNWQHGAGTSKQNLQDEFQKNALHLHLLGFLWAFPWCEQKAPLPPMVFPKQEKYSAKNSNHPDTSCCNLHL